METYELSILNVIISVALLITWFVVVAQVIAIKNRIAPKNSYIEAEHEAEIAKLSGDNEAAIKWYYRAIYYYWISSSYHEPGAYSELFKKDIKNRYYDIITQAGGIYPTKFLPADLTKEAISGIEALYKAGQYSKEEYESEKSRILGQ